MARHAQPREVAELKGALRKHPERYRKQPPAVKQPIGTAPEYMTPAARACWFELESLAPDKVLTGADRVALEVLSNLLAEYRDDPKQFSTSRITHLVGCLARLGMTPADRQKIGVEKDSAGKDDGFEQF
jgi:phage terminase small subunit